MIVVVIMIMIIVIIVIGSYRSCPNLCTTVEICLGDLPGRSF